MRYFILLVFCPALASATGGNPWGAHPCESVSRLRPPAVGNPYRGQLSISRQRVPRSSPQLDSIPWEIAPVVHAFKGSAKSSGDYVTPPDGMLIGRAGLSFNPPIAQFGFPRPVTARDRAHPANRPLLQILEGPDRVQVTLTWSADDLVGERHDGKPIPRWPATIIRVGYAVRVPAGSNAQQLADHIAHKLTALGVNLSARGPASPYEGTLDPQTDLAGIRQLVGNWVTAPRFLSPHPKPSAVPLSQLAVGLSGKVSGGTRRTGRAPHAG